MASLTHASGTLAGVMPTARTTPMSKSVNTHILSLDWHNRFLRNWELKISNLYYIHYVKNSFHYPLPITKIT
jgi:hypothetical protein